MVFDFSFLAFVLAGASFMGVVWWEKGRLQHALGLSWRQVNALSGLSSCVHKVDPAN